MGGPLNNWAKIKAPILTRTFNKILEIRKVLEVFKTGILFPILKKRQGPNNGK